MTISSIKSLLINKLEYLTITENDKQFKISFRIVTKSSKMDRIGLDLRKQFPNNEIGWGSNWIIISK